MLNTIAVSLWRLIKGFIRLVDIPPITVIVAQNYYSTGPIGKGT